MKKLSFIVLFILTIGIVFIWRIMPEPISTEQFYEQNWGIHIPEPVKEVTLYYSKHISFGDGNYIYAYSYSTQTNMEKSDLLEVTKGNVNMVNERAHSFLAETIAIYNDQQTINIINQLKIEADIGDAYLHTSKNNGNDYLIMIYKRNEKLLYILKSHS